MIDADNVYFLTYLGKNELAAAGTSLSRPELELLVLIDGKASVSHREERRSLTACKRPIAAGTVG